MSRLTSCRLNMFIGLWAYYRTFLGKMVVFSAAAAWVSVKLEQTGAARLLLWITGFGSKREVGTRAAGTINHIDDRYSLYQKASTSIGVLKPNAFVGLLFLGTGWSGAQLRSMRLDQRHIHA